MMTFDPMSKEAVLKGLLILIFSSGSAVALASLLLYTFVFEEANDLTVAKLFFWGGLGLALGATGAMISGDF